MKFGIWPTLASMIWATLATAEPMTFQFVGNGGNCYIGCSWTVATGEITSDTPEAFRAYLEADGAGPVMFHSTGGDAEAAMELARLIREADIDTMVGKSEVYSEPWYEPVEGGACTDACAIAFLGGSNRLIGLRTFNYEYDGHLSFERLGNREILGSLTDETLSGNDLLNEQISIGLFVNFLLEMGVSSELFAELSRLDIGASLTIGPELAQSLSVATSDHSQSDWTLFQLGSGLVLKSYGSEKPDGLWAFCSGDGFYLARAYSKIDAEGNPCDDDFCHLHENTVQVFEGARVLVDATEFPTRFVDVLGSQENAKALVLAEVTNDVMMALPTARKLSLSPQAASRAMLGFAQVFEWEWGASFDERLMSLALKNCID
jgi:hypothetical protein